MVVYLVVLAPEPLQGGRRDDEPRAWRRYPAALPQDRLVVGAVLDHVESGHQVEARIVEGHRLGLSLTDIVPPVVGDADGLRVVLQAHHRPIAAQVVEHVAGPAADVQNPHIVVGHNTVQHVKQRARPAGKPPVFVFLDSL